MNKFELFSQSFEDNESYTDFYFNRRKNSVKSFEEIIGHNTIALVNVADIIICNDKVQYKTALITGVCTAPQMRKKGVMHKLLSNVLDQLKKEYQLAILSPENDYYYKKYNFKSLVIGDWIN
ncbi:MAG: GNAT family N-acetyltransferase, partial [Clostridia bacterium]|nr:GNAT family N-acetyltransferase [Clostridia bacterium]